MCVTPFSLFRTAGAHIPLFTSRQVSRGGGRDRSDQPPRTLLANGLRGLPPRHHYDTRQTSAAGWHGRLRTPHEERTTQTRLHLLLPPQWGWARDPREQNGHRRGRSHWAAPAADGEMAATTRGRRKGALAVCLLPNHVQPSGKRARTLPRSSGPCADVHSAGELHVVRRQPPLPLHVGP